MMFTGEEEHNISLTVAAGLTANYREAMGEESILGSYFSKSALLKIFDQEGCVGIRIYYALTDQGAQELVMVGVNADGDDLHEGEIMERSWGCPPYCGASNSLNS